MIERDEATGDTTVRCYIGEGEEEADTVTVPAMIGVAVTRSGFDEISAQKNAMARIVGVTPEGQFANFMVERVDREIMYTWHHCLHCNENCRFLHLHDSPYGLHGGHMAGTERYRCEECGTQYFARESHPSSMKFHYDEEPR